MNVSPVYNNNVQSFGMALKTKDMDGVARSIANGIEEYANNPALGRWVPIYDTEKEAIKKFSKIVDNLKRLKTEVEINIGKDNKYRVHVTNPKTQIKYEILDESPSYDYDVAKYLLWEAKEGTLPFHHSINLADRKVSVHAYDAAKLYKGILRKLLIADDVASQFERELTPQANKSAAELKRERLINKFRELLSSPANESVAELKKETLIDKFRKLFS